MDAEMIRTFWEYSFWQSRRVWELAAPLTDAQFTRDMGYSWGSVRSIFTHMMDAEQIWLDRIHGVSPEAMPDTNRFATRGELRAAWDTLESEWRAYLATLTNEMLRQPVIYRRYNGGEQQQPLWGLLLHVCNHGTDHRAQVLFLLAQLGVPTQEQDFLFYMRQHGV